MERIREDGATAIPSRLPAWPKACATCALRPGDPQRIGADVQSAIREDVEHDLLEFLCLHRTTRRGRHRACACAAAIAATAKRRRKERRQEP